MRIVTIHGSGRDNGANAYALKIVQNELKKIEEVEIVEIHPEIMALNMPHAWPSPDAKKLQEIIKSADGVIINTPEYHGSFSSLIKMTIENMGYPSALKKKPVALLGAAGGAIGAVKSLEHLSSVMLHTGAIVMPFYVSIAHSDRAFDQEGNSTDEQVNQRLKKLAQTLVGYILETQPPYRSFEEVVREDR